MAIKVAEMRTSLVMSWVRICLPMQGTWVGSLVGEDSTFLRATKPTGHNHRALTLQPEGCKYWASGQQRLQPAHPEPVVCNKRSHGNEKPPPQRGAAPLGPVRKKPVQEQPRHSTAKNKYISKWVQLFLKSGWDFFKKWLKSYTENDMAIDWYTFVNNWLLKDA